MKTNRLFALGLMMALAGGACGDDSGGGTKNDGGPGPTTNPDGGPGPTTNPDGGPGPVNPDGGPGVVDDAGMTVTPGGGTSKTITSAGGSITSADGNLTVTFSRYAFKRATTVTVTPATTAIPGALGTIYNIGPTTEPFGDQNSPVVTVTFKYTAANLLGGSPQDLKVGQYIAGKWVELNDTGFNAVPTKANPSKSTITAQIRSLGPVALLGGVCEACPEPACTQENCVFGDQKTAGVCVPTGMGCSVCRPVCDGDKDGFCVQGVGGAPGNDCNDADPKVRPNGAVFGDPTNEWPELCNGVDDNCNLITDEGCTACTSDAACTAFGQACRDGFCNICNQGCDASNCGTVANPGHCVTWGNGCSQCFPNCDVDGDGQCPPTLDNPNGDCNEMDRNVNSGVREVCGNNIDDNCDGFIDEFCNDCKTDADCPRDGLYCIGGACKGCSTAACDMAACGATGGTCKPYGKGCSRCVALCDDDADGFCMGQGDSDNANPAVNQDVPELCGNKIDDNSNGHIDEGCTPCAKDGDCGTFQEYCTTSGACDICNTTQQADCKWPQFASATTPTVPGSLIIFGKGCSKCGPPEDADSDGYVTQTVFNKYKNGTPSVELPLQIDCDDTNAAVSPVLPEVCGNMKDDNCNNQVDELCVTCETSLMCGAATLCSNSR